MLPAEVPPIVNDSTEILGLVIAAVTCTTLLVGLLWKAFKIHDQIGDMAAQLKPNHGTSLRDAVDATRTLTESNAQALVTLRADTEAALGRVGDQTDAICKANDTAHAEIHRRIDGLFELLAGPNAVAARRLSEWHKTQRETKEG